LSEIATRFKVLFLAGALAITWLASGPDLEAQASPPRILAWTETITGPEEQPIRWPVAVTAAPGGDFGVADAFEPRLLIYRKIGISWQLERSVELPSPPIGLTHDGRRFVVSLRQGGGMVTLEGPEFSPQRLPLPDGVVPGSIGATEDGSLLVFDSASKRIVVLSREGSLQSEFPVNQYLGAIATGIQGRFFATAPETATVLTFAADGTIQASNAIPGEQPRPAWPMGIAVEPGGDLYIADRHGGRILVIDASGRWIGLGARKGWEDGLLRYPGAIARLATGELLVADLGNSRVQIFRRSDRATGQ